MPSKKAILAIALTIAVITIVRLAVFGTIFTQYPDHVQTPDSVGYIASGLALAQTGRFAISPDPKSSLEWTRTPGYPLMLSALFSIWGENLLAVGVAQIILSAITLLLAAWLAFRVTNSSSVALITAILLALDVPTFLHTQLILTETLFSLLVILIAISGVAWLSLQSRRKQNLLAFTCGLAIAIATLTRPIAYFLPFVFILALCAATLFKKLSWKVSLQTTSLLIIPWLVLVGGWQIRNYVNFGCTDISHIEGVNMLYYRGAGIIASRDQISFTDAQKKLRAEYTSEQTAAARGCGPEKAAGIQLIRAYPGLFLKEEIKGFKNFLIDSNGGDFLVYLNAYYGNDIRNDARNLSFNEVVDLWVIQHPFSLLISVFARVFIVSIYGFILFGLVVFIRGLMKIRTTTIEVSPNQVSGFIFLVILASYFAIISAGPEAYARFRVPVMPYLCILAAWGMDTFWKMLKTWKQRKTAARPIE